MRKLDILTLDLETRIVDCSVNNTLKEVFEVVCAAWFDGTNKYVRHILDLYMERQINYLQIYLLHCLFQRIIIRLCIT